MKCPERPSCHAFTVAQSLEDYFSTCEDINNVDLCPPSSACPTLSFEVSTYLVCMHQQLLMAAKEI